MPLKYKVNSSMHKMPRFLLFLENFHQKKLHINFLVQDKAQIHLKNYYLNKFDKLYKHTRLQVEAGLKLNVPKNV